jgi:hypothetical protein
MRGDVVMEQLVKASLPEARVALGKAQPGKDTADDAVSTRLELAPL